VPAKVQQQGLASAKGGMANGWHHPRVGISKSRYRQGMASARVRPTARIGGSGVVACTR
jgi:hypothetical protein